MCLKIRDFFAISTLTTYIIIKQPQVQIKIGVFSKKNLKNPEKKIFSRPKNLFAKNFSPFKKKKSSSTFEDLKFFSMQKSLKNL